MGRILMPKMGQRFWLILLVLTGYGIVSGYEIVEDDQSNIRAKTTMHGYQIKPAVTLDEHSQRRRAQYPAVFTYSEEGIPMTLSSFHLRLYETYEELSEGAEEVVKTALSKFLRTALLPRFKRPVESVVSVIHEQNQFPLNEVDGPPARRKLVAADEEGTELFMEVIVTFKFEPSPHIDNVDAATKDVMQDLDQFILLLGSFRNPELASVYKAECIYDVPGGEPDEPPPDNTDNIISPESDPNNINTTGDNGVQVVTYLPGLLAGAAIIVLASYFVLRRKQQEAELESPKGSDMFVDIENDYSMDQSLESPMNQASVQSSVQSSHHSSVQNSHYSSDYSGSSVSHYPRSTAEGDGKSVSPMGGDSVFSGVELSPKSSHGLLPNNKSLATAASATTIRVSNVQPEPSQRLLSNTRQLPTAATTSLFVFSEEGESGCEENNKDYDDDQDQSQPSLERSDCSESSSEGHLDRLALNVAAAASTAAGRQEVAPSPSETSSHLCGTKIDIPPGSALGGEDDDDDEPDWPGVGEEEGDSVVSPGMVLADLASLARSRETSPRDSLHSRPSPRSSLHSRPSPRSSQHTRSSHHGSLQSSKDGTNGTIGSAMDPTPRNASMGESPALQPVKCDSYSNLLACGLIGATPSPRSSPMISYSTEPTSPIVNSTMETPLKRNTAVATKSMPLSVQTPGSHRSQRSQRSLGSTRSKKSPASHHIHLEWDDNVEAPGSVGKMAGRASSVIGGVFGVGAAGVALAGSETSAASTSANSSGRGASESLPAQSNDIFSQPANASAHSRQSTNISLTDEGAEVISNYDGSNYDGSNHSRSLIASNHSRSVHAGSNHSRSAHASVHSRSAHAAASNHSRSAHSASNQSRNVHTASNHSRNTEPSNNSQNGEASSTHAKSVNASHHSRQASRGGSIKETIDSGSAPASPMSTGFGFRSCYVGSYGTASENMQPLDYHDVIDYSSANMSTTDDEKDSKANGAFPSLSASKLRRHVGSGGADGSAMYQASAMHPLDWSYKSADVSVGDSTITESDAVGMIPRQFMFSPGDNEPRPPAVNGGGGGGGLLATSAKPDAKSPMSHSQYSGAGMSTLSGSARTGNSTSDTNGTSHASASRQLINDLVWLERKIADVRQGGPNNNMGHLHQRPSDIDTVDSLSYISNDAFVSPSSAEDNTLNSTSQNISSQNMQSIICRDCYAPPGKLQIVIHSTKDGPAVHTVKEGSALKGHIFEGDLIISVDNVDTRSYTAEQVMKMMAAKSSYERKITVLHFEDEDE